MNSKSTCSKEKLDFDGTSAKRVPGFEPHTVYQDKNGNQCLLVLGGSKAGGVAVSATSLWNFWTPNGGISFIRLINTESEFDVMMPIDDLPTKRMTEGKYGLYCFFDPSDFCSDKDETFPPYSEFQVPLGYEVG